MLRFHSLPGIVVLLLMLPHAAEASWIFQPSYYSHDPGGTGQRVHQFAEPAPAYVRTDPTYLQSAYRHNETSIRAGDGADHLHIVETWGAGDSIRPYGEWLFPYRAGATPYGPWGNPQGPWTLPFDSWVNPLGQSRLYPPYYSPYSRSPYSPGPGMPAAGPRSPDYGPQARPWTPGGRGPQGALPRQPAPPSAPPITD